jgi:hypothetical protein
MIMAITKEYSSRLIVSAEAPKKANMKAWKIYLIESKTKTVPCLDSSDRLLKPYFEKMIAVVNREIMPESPRNYPRK